MKSQLYLCVDLKTQMQKSSIAPKQPRKGILTMLDEEHFLFREAQNHPANRNPRIWSGDTLNVSQKEDGELRINFKNLELREDTNIIKIVRRIYFDLVKSKKDLGL